MSGFLGAAGGGVGEGRAGSDGGEAGLKTIFGMMMIIMIMAIIVTMMIMKTTMMMM